MAVFCYPVTGYKSMKKGNEGKPKASGRKRIQAKGERRKPKGNTEYS